MSTVAVVGATGAVGRTILTLLSERAFPATEIVPFASTRSAGQETASTLRCSRPGRASRVSGRRDSSSAGRW